MNEKPLNFIMHMLDSIKHIEIFMEGISKKYFINNREKQNAVIREIEIIGEAAANLSVSFRDENPQIPWKNIVGTRDKMIHHYFGVNLDVVWEVIKKDIPVLKRELEKIKKSMLKNGQK